MKKNRNNKGYSMIMVPIIIGLLMCFMAISIDFGRILILKHQLQSAADAAAIAGASMIKIEFESDDTGKFNFDSTVKTLVDQKALAEADYFFDKNVQALKLESKGVKIIDKKSEINNNNKFQYSVRAQIPMFLGKTFLGMKDTQGVSVISEAQTNN